MRPVVLSALRLHLFKMLMSVLSRCFFTTKCFLLTNTLLFIIGVIYCNTAHSCLMMNWNLIIYVCAKPLCLYVAGFFVFKFDVVRLVWAQISPGKDEERSPSGFVTINTAGKHPDVLWYPVVSREWMLEHRFEQRSLAMTSSPGCVGTNTAGKRPDFSSEMSSGVKFKNV